MISCLCSFTVKYLRGVAFVYFFSIFSQFFRLFLSFFFSSALPVSMMFENQLIIIVAIIFKLKYTRHGHARTQGVHQSIHIVFALHFSN